MRASVVSIGNELVCGATVDTNASYISTRLQETGFEMVSHASVTDDGEQIELCVEALSGHCELVVLSGGLGPTADDVTRQVIADHIGCPLGVNEEWKKVLASRYGIDPGEFSEAMLSQTLIPKGALPLQNEVGTALGFLAEGTPGIAVLPGVPSEMRRMLDGYLVPALSGRSDRVVMRRSVNVFGLKEAETDRLLCGIIDPSGNPSVGITAEQSVIKVAATVRAGNRDEAETILDGFETCVREKLGDNVFGTDADDLAAALASLLMQSGATLAVAESCTGGLITHRLTEVPGISSVLLMGMTAYSNDVKISHLGVAPEAIEAYGAVSEPVVAAMAEGIRRLAGADYGIGVTGIAGPSGSTEEKPLGTVWIAVAGPQGSQSSKFLFHGERTDIKMKAANAALDMLRRTLTE